MITFRNYFQLNEVATSQPSAAGNIIKETHRGTRNLPLSNTLKTAIGNGLAGTGLGWHSYSGGQPSTGTNRVGSHRHDNGNGSDGDFFELSTGRVLNGDNNADRAKISDALKKLKQSGIQGFGWDSSSSGKGHYMGSTRFHLDVSGPPGVWGSSKRSDTAAPWVVSAIGGVPQGDVQGDMDDGTEGTENMPPGEGQSSDYESPDQAAQGLMQGLQTAFGFNA